MSDEEYEECIAVTNFKAFTAWASEILLAEARKQRDTPRIRGTVVGGDCASPECAVGYATYKNIFTDKYFCALCAIKVNEMMPETCKLVTG